MNTHKLTKLEYEQYLRRINVWNELSPERKAELRTGQRNLEEFI